MLEVDCHLTKDGKVVVFHDSNLLRLTGIDKDISALSYHELPTLKSVVSIDFEPGEHEKVTLGRRCTKLTIYIVFLGSNYENENPQTADRRIPLLEDLFKIFKRTPINIDIKTDNDELIKEVSRLITNHNREEYCVWGNTNCYVTRKCYKEVRIHN